MGKILPINEYLEREQDLVEKLSTMDILAYEDVQGSKIFVNYNPEKGFRIKPKSLKNEHLNVIDLAIQKLYYEAFQFFENLSDRVKTLLDLECWYIFQYFTDNEPANIKYDNVPKNGLILTGIINEKDRQKVYNDELIKEWAQVLDVDILPVIFEGRLTGEQIKKIKDFYQTSPEDLEFIFGESNFAEYFFKVLDSRKSRSYLMRDKFQENLERIIIKFKNNEEIALALFNPLYQKHSINNATEYEYIYSIILSNFMEWFQLVDLSEVELQSQSKDDAFLELICKLFNVYYRDASEGILTMDLQIPEFYRQDKFEINPMLIKNDITQSLISEDEQARYILKLLLMSFSKKRKKKIGVFTDQTVEVHNQIVDNLEMIVGNCLELIPASELRKKGYLTFVDLIQGEDAARKASKI